MAFKRTVWNKLPRWPKRIVRRLVSPEAERRRLWAASNPYAGTDEEWAYDGPSPHTLGIIAEYTHRHAYYMRACHDLGVGYRVIDISRDDWIDQVEVSGCSHFLVWPSAYSRVYKELSDRRTRILVENLGKTVFPSLKETWLYESKSRTRDWLVANGVEHPRTWVFHRFEHARAFLETARYPLVHKTDFGAAAAGVRILLSPTQALKLARKLFRGGIVLDHSDLFDRQRGTMILQEFLPGVNEWRLVRIGDTYLCRFKERVGQFHSGGGRVRWAQPPHGLLERTREITEIEGFRSRNVDFFETTDGRFLVNELHAVFGDIRPENRTAGEELMGSWRRAGDGGWTFVPGYAYTNSCANLRVQYLVERIEAERGMETVVPADRDRA